MLRIKATVGMKDLSVPRKQLRKTVTLVKMGLGVPKRNAEDKRYLMIG